MINFRFHLVSLIAIFLALALGVVIGAGVIDRGVVDTLNTRLDTVESNSERIKGENSELRDRNGQLEGFVGESTRQQSIDRASVRCSHPRCGRRSTSTVSRRLLRLSTTPRSMTVEPITMPSASARNTAMSDTRWKRKLIIQLSREVLEREPDAAQEHVDRLGDDRDDDHRHERGDDEQRRCRGAAPGPRRAGSRPWRRRAPGRAAGG